MENSKKGQDERDLQRLKDNMGVVLFGVGCASEKWVNWQQMKHLQACCTMSSILTCNMVKRMTSQFISVFHHI